MDKFDQQKIESLGSDLCDPTKCNILLRSKSFENETDTIEEWYKTKYIVRDIDEKLINKILSPNVQTRSKKLDLPPANKLIPKNFGIKAQNKEFADKP